MWYEFSLERSIYKNVSFFAKDEQEAMDIANKLASDFGEGIAANVLCDDEQYDFHLVWAGEEEE